MIRSFTGILALVGLSLAANGQLMDDFSDGNFDNWFGHTTHFIVNANEQLQLNAPVAGESSLATDVSFADSMVWEFYINLDFAPSTSNQLKVMLAFRANDADTSVGYFLEIGAGGDQDPLWLKYIDENGDEVVIGMSVPGLVADEPVALTLRVERDANNNWAVYDIGGAIPELLFTGNHAGLPMGDMRVFGFYAKYTDTRRDKFFFDNIHIYPPQPDQTPPVWQTINVVDQQNLELQFNEPLAVAPAMDLNNYTVNNGIGHPDQVSLNVTRNTVTLHFATLFESLQPYVLAIQQLFDDAGNIIAPESRNFTFIAIGSALPYEILVTEIMADPTPVVSLPDAEYIELHNASDKSFQLSDYTLRVGSGERNLPAFVLQPGSFVIITDQDMADEFAPYGDVAGIDMPSLTNSGATIAILNAGDEIIHSVEYTDEWYNDSDKADGGWSLEMKQPAAICLEAENWSASEDLSGGTPGKVNSNWLTLPDVTGPALISLFPETPTRIVLRFSERLDEVLMLNAALYTITPATQVQDVTLQDANTVVLTLQTPLLAGTSYSLLPFTASDCLGNESTVSGIAEFGLIVDAMPGDLLINEILFNPASGGSRFIEVINVSNAFIDLSTLAIGRITENQQDIYTTGVQEALGPGEHAAFTPDRADIIERYEVPNLARLYTASLPSWDEETDNASILANGVVIDSFTYSADWHHPVLADQNGVSLERVSTEAPTSLASNWHSASSLHRYGTPTGVNSQALADTTDVAVPYSVINRIFSPDGDGFRDFLAIQFESGTADAITSAWIYDMEGREVYQLINNELVGSASLLQWDGRHKDGKLADMGMYILLVQLWRPDGEVTKYQTSCALVKR